MIACYEGPWGMAGSVIFWISYETMTIFILLGMFVMVVASTFDELDILNREFRLEGIFKGAWNLFDPHATGFVPINQLLSFLEALGPR